MYLPLFLLLSLGGLNLGAEENKKDELVLAPGLYARFVTNKGELLFLLDYENLPMTVSNFCLMAREGWFENRDFFNRVKNYVLFLGEEGRGEEKTFPREEGGRFSCGEAGALTMASVAGNDKANQMLILIKGDAFLDRKYTAFGRMVSGLNILEKLKITDKVLSVTLEKIGTQAEAFQPDHESLQALIKEAEKKKREEFAHLHPQVAAVLESLGEGVKESATGIFYKTQLKGEGGHPRPGNKVLIHYSGKLVSGEEFDSSFRRNKPFQFTIGVDGVIPGWVETALSMQPGEKRTVVIPPELAYGESGYGPIPPDSWLVFDMELLDFQ